MRRALALCSCSIAAGLIGTSVLVSHSLPSRPDAVRAVQAGAGGSVAEAALTPPPPALPAAPDGRPSRLLIPRIGVDALIEARGLDSSRNLSTPADFNDVAWFNQGPAPGQPGNAIINGHVDWWTGPAVFTRLAELRAGDQVLVVRADGSRASFTVTGSRLLAASARDASLFAPAAAANLTLITCSGWWDPRLGGTTERLLVSAGLD